MRTIAFFNRLVLISAISLSTIVKADGLPECHPDYDEWISVGAPDSWWSISRQCRGDTDGKSTGSKLQGYAYVNATDLALLLSTWTVKEPPEGPGLSIDQLAGDFDHRASDSPYIGYNRIGTNDYCIFLEYLDIKEPPKGPGVPKCPLVGAGGHIFEYKYPEP